MKMSKTAGTRTYEVTETRTKRGEDKTSEEDRVVQGALAALTPLFPACEDKMGRVVARVTETKSTNRKRMKLVIVSSRGPMRRPTLWE